MGGAIMLTVTANMLKTKGISAFNEALNENEEAIISVHGKNKFVVLSMEKYNYLRECELEAALLEAKQDLKTGNIKTDSVDSHMKRVLNG